MKQRQVRATAIIIILVLGLVAYYAFLSARAKDNKAEAAMSAREIVLSRNLNNDYPATPREVMKYYNEITKCMYNEELTGEEIDELGMKAREVYDDDLLAINETGGYLLRLRNEVKEGNENQRKITLASVASSSSVDYFTDDGYSWARILCTYNINENGTSLPQQRIIYLLRKDSGKRWKIYGWDLEENVHPEAVGTDEGSGDGTDG
ncbi:MAG: hypothetical protein K6G57_08630 [Lachnospiraceae bacterium]|nr:hypothetical protein [Lachnospiraceae bacterium]